MSRSELLWKLRSSAAPKAGKVKCQTPCAEDPSSVPTPSSASDPSPSLATPRSGPRTLVVTAGVRFLLVDDALFTGQADRQGPRRFSRVHEQIRIDDLGPGPGPGPAPLPMAIRSPPAARSQKRSASSSGQDRILTRGVSPAETHLITPISTPNQLRELFAATQTLPFTAHDVSPAVDPFAVCPSHFPLAPPAPACLHPSFIHHDQGPIPEPFREGGLVAGSFSERGGSRWRCCLDVGAEGGDHPAPSVGTFGLSVRDVLRTGTRPLLRASASARSWRPG